MPETTDQELIARVREGRQEAYAELVRRHHARVYSLCASMLGDRAQAEDAAQEVFLKAYARLADFRADAAFSTWLYRIAANRCLDLKRAEARRRTESWEALVESDAPRLQRLIADPRDETRALEDADLAARALDALPPDYRLILTLREVEGLDYKEIMAAMDCSLDSVKARLRRARALLREKLGHFLPKESV